MADKYKYRWFAAIVLCVLGVVAALQDWRGTELAWPSSGGKWQPVMAVDGGQLSGAQLIALLEIEESPWSRFLNWLNSRQRLIRFKVLDADTARGMAASGFMALGAEGIEMVPAISQIAVESNQPSNALFAAMCILGDAHRKEISLSSARGQTIKNLQRFLICGDASLRRRAVGCLSFLARDSYVDVECSLAELGDKVGDVDVQLAILGIFYQSGIDHGCTFEYLMDALRHPHGHVRTAAAAALSRQGSKAEAALPALNSLLADPWAREWATIAIDRIGKDMKLRSHANPDADCIDN